MALRGKWPLSLMAALCLASVVLVTVLNYYGFAASRLQVSKHVSPEPSLLGAQMRNQALLEEIRDLLRRSAPVNQSDLPAESSVVPTTTTTQDVFSEFPANHDNSNIHIVFSVSCGQRNRLLQQTVVQLTASWAGQKGPITEILSGCSESEKLRVMEEPTFYYDFRHHFTPSYASNPEPGVDDNYAPYNKPFGLRHFLLNAVPAVQHDIIALIDADFFFFRPLEVNTGKSMLKYYHGHQSPSTVNDTVRDGMALAQDWNALQGGLFAQDKDHVLSQICGDLPCGNISREDGAEYYGNIGPPYIMTRHDILRMVDDYCHLCVKTRRVFNEWIAEMFAYSLAAANNGIKHTALSHLGVSSPSFEAGGHEYWSFVTSKMANPCENNLVPVIPKDSPIIVHACQWIGNFYKGVWPSSLAKCDSPMFKIPPPTDWSEINTTIDSKIQQTQREEVWAKCTLTKIMNRALFELKQRTCPSGFNTFRSVDAVRVN